MKTTVKWIDNLSFVGKTGSNHLVPMDTRPEVGGGGSAPTPMELLLLGLGGCTGMDVVSILKKMREPLDDFEIKIDSERGDEHPKVYTKISLKYIFYGKGLKEKNVERAIQLSEDTYCSASAMLKKTAEITTSYEIRESKKSEQ